MITPNLETIIDIKPPNVPKIMETMSCIVDVLPTSYVNAVNDLSFREVYRLCRNESIGRLQLSKGEFNHYFAMYRGKLGIGYLINEKV